MDQVPDQFAVVLEAAGGDDDPPAGADLVRPRVRREPDAGDAAAVDQQVDGPHSGTGGDAPVQTALEQGGDQAPSQPLQGRLGPPAQELGGDDPGSAAAGDLAEAQAPHGADHPFPPGAQPPGVEQRGLQGAAASGQAAGVLGVVVGVAGDQFEAERRLALQPVQGGGDVVDERLDQLRAHAAVGQRVQVGQRLFPAVVDTGLGGVAVAGEPDDAAGERRRAADPVGLLEQPHRGAVARRCQRGGQAGGAGAEHHHVVLAHRTTFRIV